MKKVLLSILSALLLAGCAAGAVSGGADAPDVSPTAAPEVPATTETAETVETAATPAPTPDAPQGLVPTGAAVLDYDEIRLIDYSREWQTYPDADYYTMCKDGKWGLMRSDGTEVLPCRAPEPLFECNWNAHHWHGYLDGLYGMANYDAVSIASAQKLAEGSDGYLCAEHDGGGYRGFVYLQDNTLRVYCGSLGPGQLDVPTDGYMLLYSGRVDGFVPARDGEVEPESDGWVNFIGSDRYVYRNRSNQAANGYIYTAADCFFDAPLAPAQRDGKWVYLDTTGHEVTDLCYDGVYQPYRYTDKPLVYTRAAPLLSGYAVVSRGEKFGLLDSAGAEFVPCEYDGLVWDGGTAWVKQADGWHEYTIPGAAKADPLDALPDDIIAPDTFPARTDKVFYRTDADSTNRLNLRTGPGLEYPIIGKIPSDTLRIYGYSSTYPGWALVRYDPLYDTPQFGWVSMMYLILEE